MTRLEFQDGKRKRYVDEKEMPGQFYHGRGTVHAHLLVWLDNVEDIGLEDKISATVPQDNAVMAGLVEGSQRSYTGSGWPVHEGPSKYDAETKQLHLHHTKSDFSERRRHGKEMLLMGVRAFVKDSPFNLLADLLPFGLTCVQARVHMNA